MSLRWKLGGALLLVVVISVGIMAFLTNRNTTAQFQQYIQGGNTVYTQRLVDNLEQYYAQENSWNGVQEILNVSLRTASDRLVLADNSGKIISDTSGQAVGQPAESLNNPGGLALQVSGQNVGTLYATLANTGMGKGYMGGRGMMGNTSTSTSATDQTTEGDFLNQVNRYIWIAAIISLAVALLLGIFLTRQIIRPLRDLDTGAKYVAEGDLAYRVNVRSRDEIGSLAESFNEMAMKLDNSEQSRRRLVSDVAHELRTPLTIIQGTVDGIEDGVFSADKEHLDSIKEQTNLLDHLVNDLRDLSLAESGQLKLDLQPVDMVQLIQRKLAQFGVSAHQKNIRLEQKSPVNLPEIQVDPRRMEQVIGNLLSNAIRHTPSGGQITVETKVRPDSYRAGKESLIVSVKDTGKALLPNICRTFSNAFIGWKARGHAVKAEPVSV